MTKELTESEHDEMAAVLGLTRELYDQHRQEHAAEQLSRDVGMSEEDHEHMAQTLGLSRAEYDRNRAEAEKRRAT